MNSRAWGGIADDSSSIVAARLQCPCANSNDFCAETGTAGSARRGRPTKRSVLRAAATSGVDPGAVGARASRRSRERWATQPSRRWTVHESIECVCGKKSTPPKTSHQKEIIPTGWWNTTCKKRNNFDVNWCDLGVTLDFGAFAFALDLWMFLGSGPKTEPGKGSRFLGQESCVSLNQNFYFGDHNSPCDVQR